MSGLIALLVWLIALLIVWSVLKEKWRSSQSQKATWFVPGFEWLKDSTRNLATLVIGGKGSGKSFSSDLGDLYPLGVAA